MSGATGRGAGVSFYTLLAKLTEPDDIASLGKRNPDLRDEPAQPGVSS